MNKKQSSILDELCQNRSQDKTLFIENRAIQIIASVTNLMNLFENTYDKDTSDELKRRLLNSIKSGDDTKFRRKIKEMK